LGAIDIFSVRRGIFWNILEQMAILGVRSVPKNTNSATTLESSPAQFVHTCTILRGTALYSVRHIFEDRSKNLRATTNMDVLLNDADDLIELITILFFTPGGKFYLTNEVLHDLEEEEQPVVWGSSWPGKAPNLERHRVMYAHLLFNDFWGATPVYNAMYFRRFFKFPIGLFNNIVERIVLHDSYFIQRTDACGRIGLSTFQKVCSAFRLLTSGVSSIELDDKYRMAASTGMECFKRVCEAVIAIYSEDALRHPTVDDIN
jgi:hypothetical protein